MIPVLDSLSAQISTLQSKQWVLISGASSAIAKALINKFCADKEHNIIALSRGFDPELTHLANRHQQLKLIETDYSESHILAVTQFISRHQIRLSSVFICNGFLHSEEHKPEKTIASFDSDFFIKQLQVNTLIPTLWLKYLLALKKQFESCFIVVLSARVGSISDNKLGGWYSYRTTKAALNMMLKTAAIEYARHSKQVKLVAFHPGTTDTPLSKPFQANVAAGKLFSTQFVAAQLCTQLAKLEFNGQAQFIDWQGKNVTW